MSKIEKEFVIQQYYKATVDESVIESSYSDPEADYAKDDIAKWHRMFRAIRADEKALEAVLEFKTIIEQASESSSSYGFLESHYGDKDTEFPHILARFAGIFAQEDRDWLLSLIKEHAEVKAKITPRMDHEDYERIGYFDLCIQTEALEDCFQVEQSGWNIHSH